jgi:hypothetical protein
VSKLYVIGEVTEMLAVEKQFVVHCLRAHWITPASPENLELDEADIARLRLIWELKSGFGVNDEAIPVILHLLDQLHTLHGQLQGGDLRSYLQKRLQGPT